MNTNLIRVTFSLLLLCKTQNVMASSSQVTKNFKLQSIFNSDIKTSLANDNGYKVIDFWASWCQSCKTNLEQLEVMQKKLNKSNSSSKVLAVSVDESKEEAKNFFEASGPGSGLKAMKKNAWLDYDQQLSKQLKFEGVPYLIVVDPAGKIVHRHSGSLSKADVKKIQKLISSNH